MFDDYPQYALWFARVQLILFMLGMGVNLSVSDFVQVFRQPRALVLGLIGQVCVIPFVAVALNRLLDLEPPIALGLIMVAAMPGGALSKMFAYFGRGNAPLSITLTAVSTLATLVTVPATLGLLASTVVPEDMAMPVGLIIADVLAFLLAPLAVGMVVGRLVPRRRQAISRWSFRIGCLVVLGMIVGSLGSGLIQPGSQGWRVPLAIILFCLLGQQLNMAPFYLLGLPRADRLAVGMEVTMRNMNLAFMLNESLFGTNEELHGGVLFVALFYSAVALGGGALLGLNHRRLSRREPLAPLPLQS